MPETHAWNGLRGTALGRSSLGGIAPHWVVKNDGFDKRGWDEQEAEEEQKEEEEEDEEREGGAGAAGGANLVKFDKVQRAQALLNLFQFLDSRNSTKFQTFQKA